MRAGRNIDCAQEDEVSPDHKLLPLCMKPCTEDTRPGITSNKDFSSIDLSIYQDEPTAYMSPGWTAKPLTTWRAVAEI